MRCNVRSRKHCTTDERIYTANQHVLIYRAKKHGTGWMDGRMDGRAWLRIAYSSQKSWWAICHFKLAPNNTILYFEKY